MTVEIVPLTDLKDYIGEDSTTRDAELTRVLEGVSRLIRRRLPGPIEIQNVSEMHDGQGTQSLILDHYPVVDVVSLAVGDHAVDVDTEKAAGELLVIPPSEVWRVNGFGDGERSVQITVQAGLYDADAPEAVVPEDLALAVLMVCKFYVNASLDARSIFWEGGGAGPERAWPNQAREILSSYGYRFGRG